MALVEIRNLKKYFETPAGMLHAVDDVSLEIEKGRPLGLWVNRGVASPPWASA